MKYSQDLVLRSNEIIQQVKEAEKLKNCKRTNCYNGMPKR